MSALDQPIPQEDEQADEVRQDRFNALMSQRQVRHGRVQNYQGMALRARGQVIQEELGQQRHEVAQGQLELNRLKAMSELRKQELAQQLQAQHTQQVSRAFEAMKDISFDSPDFIPKVTALIRDNPLVVKEPLFESFVKLGTQAIQTRQAADQHIREHEATQRLEFGRLHEVDVIDPQDGHERTIQEMAKVAQDAGSARAKAAMDDPANKGLERSGVTVKTPDGTVTLARPTAAAIKASSTYPMEVRLQKAYGLNRDHILDPTYLERGKMGADGKFAGDNDGPLYRVTTNEGTTHLIPTQQFDAYKAHFSAPTPAAPTSPTQDTERPLISPEDQQALDWATENPNDPRADAIKKLHGQ